VKNSERRRVQQTEAPTMITKRTRNGEPRFGKSSQQREQVILVAETIWQAQRKYDVQVREMRLERDGYGMLVETPKLTLADFMQYTNARLAEGLNRMQNESANVWYPRYQSTVVQRGEHEDQAIAELYAGLGAAERLDVAFDPEAERARFYAFGRLVTVERKDDRWHVSWEEIPEAEPESDGSEKKGKAGKSKKGKKRGKQGKSRKRGPRYRDSAARIGKLALLRQVMPRRVYGHPEFVEWILSHYRSAKGLPLLSGDSSGPCTDMASNQESECPALEAS